jgi:hypothetical protein
MLLMTGNAPCGKFATKLRNQGFKQGASFFKVEKNEKD